MEKREKSEAGRNEEADISYIIESINCKNETGLQLLQSYTSDIGEGAILSLEPRVGGNRKKHYDFIGNLSYDVQKKVEHKSTFKYIPILPDAKPWDGGVQFHNGGCELYPFTTKYMRLWYDLLIASGKIKDTYKITAAIPTYEEFCEECKRQKDPKGDFTHQLKYRAGLMRDERKLVLDALELDEEDLASLKTRVFEIANKCLSEKELWVTINGNIRGKFYSKWYPQFRIKTIDTVEVRKELDLKIYFTCKIEVMYDNEWVEAADPFIFYGHLRWGSHQGITNLRFDLK